MVNRFLRFISVPPSCVGPWLDGRAGRSARRSHRRHKKCQTRHTAMEWRLFADVPREDVRRLLAIARRPTLPRNEGGFHRGGAAEGLLLIVEGRFAVAITTPLGETAMLGV